MIQLENVTKIFGTGVAGLSDITLSVEKGEFVFLVGHTGSGKTTLLRLLIHDMVATEGKIQVGEFDVVNLPNHKIPHLRKKVGVIFQDLKLLSDRTIFENVLLPMQFGGVHISEAKNRTEELLDQVGILVHKDKFPVQLSGGELQRVAIARALSLYPDILLADEPTGNLDAATAFDIVDLLTAINKRGTTVIMATHNIDILKKHPHRIVALDNGKLIRDEKKREKIHSKEEQKKVEEKIPSAFTGLSIETMEAKKSTTDKEEKKVIRSEKGKEEQRKKSKA